MRLLFRVEIFVICLLVVLTCTRVSGQVNVIEIDGDMNDWNGIEPILEEEDVIFDPWFDVQRGYITVNETSLFIKIDYAGRSEEFLFHYSNVTIRTPNGKCYVLCITVNFIYSPVRTFALEGISLLSPYHPPTGKFFEYYGNAAFDNSTTNSTESTFPLADFGLEHTDTIDISFWHVEDYLAGTVYNVNLYHYTIKTLDTEKEDQSLFSLSIPLLTWSWSIPGFGFWLILCLPIIIVLKRKIIL